MSRLLRGNYEVEGEITEEAEAPAGATGEFEKKALSRLGGSICFVSTKGFLWQGEVSGAEPRAERIREQGEVSGAEPRAERIREQGEVSGAEPRAERSQGQGEVSGAEPRAERSQGQGEVSGAEPRAERSQEQDDGAGKTAGPSA